MEIGLDILDRAFSHEDSDTGWITKGDLRLPMEFSAESIWPILAENPTGYFYYSEFDMFIDGLKRDYVKGAGAFLTDLYDVPNRERTRKLMKATITVPAYPTVSILGATTISGFLETVKESDVKRGFMPRWFVVVALKKERSFDLPEEENIVKKNLLTMSLREIAKAYDISRTNNPIQMRFTTEASEKYKMWFHSFEANIDDNMLLSPFFYRLPTYAIKFAMVEAMNMFSPDINIQHLDAALDLISFMPESLKYLEEHEFVFTDYERDRQKVLNTIKSTPTGSITRKQLTRKVRIPKRDLDSIISSLKESGQIEEPLRAKSEKSDKPVTHYVFNESGI